MSALTHRIDRTVRATISRVLRWIPEWSNWDSIEWDNELHRRDRWG